MYGDSVDIVGTWLYYGHMNTPKLKPKKRDLHLHLDTEYDEKLKEISRKLWADQKRNGEPTDIAGVSHAINVTHDLMFAVK